MSVSEILEGLTANGYKFASREPKKNLFARIYRLKGVKQVGPGQVRCRIILIAFIFIPLRGIERSSSANLSIAFWSGLKASNSI